MWSNSTYTGGGGRLTTTIRHADHQTTRCTHDQAGIKLPLSGSSQKIRKKIRATKQKPQYISQNCFTYIPPSGKRLVTSTRTLHTVLASHFPPRILTAISHLSPSPEPLQRSSKTQHAAHSTQHLHATLVPSLLPCIHLRCTSSTKPLYTLTFSISAMPNVSFNLEKRLQVTV